MLGSEDFKHRISGWVLINAEANKEEAAIAVIKEMPVSFRRTFQPI